MPDEQSPIEDDPKRVRCWLDGKNRDEVERLQLTLGVLVGGIVINRDRVINLLVREALDARAEKIEAGKVKARAKRSARAVRHNDHHRTA